MYYHPALLLAGGELTVVKVAQGRNLSKNPQHNPVTEPLPPRTSHYIGHELESMHFATNYRDWILDVFRPFFGKRIVEVGAGSGSVSEMLLGTNPEWLVAIEPSNNMYPLLAQRMKNLGPEHSGYAYHGTLLETLESIRKTGTPDTVLYVNVLEHVEDDERELQAIHSLLQPGGHALIFVPAHTWLMGSMDRELGHYRRYTMAELADKCRAAGFTIRLSSYFDMLGVAPWWITYCLLRSKSMDPSLVRLYDRYAVGLSRFLDRILQPPLGKNVILVAEKSN